MALLAVLAALALLGAWIVVAHRAAAAERGAATLLAAQELSQQVAEGAVEQVAAAPPAALARLGPGEEVVALADSSAAGPVTVRATGLGRGIVLLVSEAVVRPGGRWPARRRVSLLLAPRVPAPPLVAALATTRGATLDGDVVVDGHAVDVACGSPRDAAGHAHAPDAATAASGGAVVDGVPADTTIQDDPLASAAWREAVEAATVRLPAGAVLSPAPALDAGGACDMRAPGSWGEPRRDPGAVAPCEPHRAVVHATGDLHLVGDARGQGILAVEGALRVTGRLAWSGVVLARGGVRVDGGLALDGALVATRAELRPAAGETARVRWSSCAVGSALRAATRPRRLAGRGWAQLP